MGPRARGRALDFKNALLSRNASLIDLRLSVSSRASFARPEGTVAPCLLVGHDGYPPCSAGSLRGSSARGTRPAVRRWPSAG